jgi:hypothetical protein
MEGTRGNIQVGEDGLPNNFDGMGITQRGVHELFVRIRDMKLKEP